MSCNDSFFHEMSGVWSRLVIKELACVLVFSSGNWGSKHSHCLLDMDSLKLSSGLIFIQLVLLAFVFNSANAQLKVGFYKDTCPQAEAIVKGVMDQVLKVAPSLSGPLLRLHFHDCFVRVRKPLIHFWSFEILKQFILFCLNYSKTLMITS